MLPLVTIEATERWDKIPAGDTIPLRVTVSRPANQHDAVFIPANGLRHQSQALRIATDLLTREVELRPGESFTVEISVRFDVCGLEDLSRFSIVVKPSWANSIADYQLVPLPAHPFRVVPSLDRAVDVQVTRICKYDNAEKVEVVVLNQSSSDMTDVELTIGPSDSVRAGPLRRREPRLRPKQEIRFDLVVTCETIEFTLAATIDGERVESKRSLAMPSREHHHADTPAAFVFLEPRALTTDRITLVPEGTSAEVTGTAGVFPVRGGKSRYVLTVYPSHPQATSVRLYSAAGQVEVEPITKPGHQWSFLITIVENPMLTQLVRLDYDVQVSGTPLRGELYLSVRPTNWKLWGFAATGGLALTAKGVAGLGPALLRYDGGVDGLVEHLGNLVELRWFDWLQAGSILVIRGGLWVADRVWRPLQEG